MLVYSLRQSETAPVFNDSVRTGECSEKKGLVAYYSNRCPFAEFHVKNSLMETAKKRDLPLKIVKLESREEAQQAPSPATIFSLFYQGKFLTTDISVCLNSRFDKIIIKTKNS